MRELPVAGLAVAFPRLVTYLPLRFLLIFGMATLLGAWVLLPSARAQDELFVTNDDVVSSVNNSVTVYARTASGNTAPFRTLQGGATGLNGPAGFVVDTLNNELVVANSRTNSITAYARTASGNTA
ncbi:MAG TPA: hypothetical protein VFF86_08560, partial [Candidatus Methylomirabilis sp.]|nr:hypothetical protein [Candidatus Methylomirabilis sp.]